MLFDQLDLFSKEEIKRVINLLDKGDIGNHLLRQNLAKGVLEHDHVRRERRRNKEAKLKAKNEEIDRLATIFEQEKVEGLCRISEDGVWLNIKTGGMKKVRMKFLSSYGLDTLYELGEALKGTEILEEMDARIKIVGLLRQSVKYMAYE